MTRAVRPTGVPLVTALVVLALAATFAVLLWLPSCERDTGRPAAAVVAEGGGLTIVGVSDPIVDPYTIRFFTCEAGIEVSCENESHEALEAPVDGALEIPRSRWIRIEVSRLGGPGRLLFEPGLFNTYIVSARGAEIPGDTGR